MKVLIACEYSGITRKAFQALGHDVYSCDLLPAEDGETKRHIQGDVLEILEDGWDLMIAHPPCTDLATSGSRWFKEKIADGRQCRALDFVRKLLEAPVLHICLENPVSVISGSIRKPDQVIQPWQFGHIEKKKTCLWLKNLPLLEPTNIIPIELRSDRIHMMPDRKDRWKDRSRSFQGIAEAMARQYTDYCLDFPEKSCRL